MYVKTMLQENLLTNSEYRSQAWLWCVSSSTYCQ